MRALYKILSIISILICLLLIVNYGLRTYSAIIKRSGLYDDMHLYYDLSFIQYSVYTILVVLFGFGFIGFLLNYMIKKNSNKLKWTIWMFLIFICTVILFEEIKWTGKP